jgi:hypothetical protein
MQKVEILIALFLASFAGEERADDETRFSMVLYCGRRDPTWKGTDEVAKKFTAKFDELKIKDANELPPGALGYRGFMVDGFRSYQTIRVWNGTVEATLDGKTVRWEDKDRAMEKYLLETSKPYVSDQEYKIASDEIEAKKGVRNR